MKYKQTPIGRIPKEWEVVRLEDVADYINGYAFSPRDWQEKGLPIIRIQNLNDPEAEFNYFDGEIDKKYIVEKGDLLFSWSASIGVYIWNRGKAVLNQHIFKVVPKENVDKLYLYYALYLAIEQLKNRVHGSTMKHFKRSELKTTFLPLPPLPEQKKIAEILSTIDKAIQKVNEAIAKTERLKKGLIQELLTKGIGHKEFKDMEIGRIPKEWKIVKLEDVAKVFDCKHRTPTYYSEGFPVLLPRNVQEGRISLEDAPRTSYEEYLDLTEKYKPARGDIIYTRNAKVGVAGMVMANEEFALGQDLVGIRPLKKVESNYLLYVLNSSIIRRYLLKAQTGSTFKRINLSLIRKLKIPLPPLPEQQKIAKILSTVDKKLELERKRKEKLERIKKGMMDLLLTGKVRVKGI